MAITAAKLGKSPITIDWSNLACFEPKSHAESPETTQEFENAWNHLKARIQSGEVGFYNAPTQLDLSEISATEALAEKLLSKNQFKDVLFLGIGGSALGPVSLLYALQHLKKSDLKFHFLENPDPQHWKRTLGKLNPDQTLL